jgi:hypothetical protein
MSLTKKEQISNNEVLKAMENLRAHIAHDITVLEEIINNGAPQNEILEFRKQSAGRIRVMAEVIEDYGAD